MMKAIWKIMAACLLLAAACQNPVKQNFIPGTYVQHAKGEYGVADDTLTIQHADGSSYHITQRTTYRAIRDGKVMPAKHKVQHFDASWDETTQELNEAATGRSIMLMLKTVR